MSTTRAATIALWVSLVGAAPGGVAADTVYRCGNAYTQRPCAQAGRDVEVDAGDRRSARQIADARKSIADQQRAARQLEIQRHAFERAHPSRPAAAIGQVSTPSSPRSSAGTKGTAQGSAKAGRPAGKAATAQEFVALQPGSGSAPRQRQSAQD